MRTLIAEGWGVEAAAEQVERWLEAEKRALGNDAPKHFAIQAERIMRIYNHKNKMRRGVKVVEK